MALFSRKSNKHAGTRYHARGLNDVGGQGNVKLTLQSHSIYCDMLYTLRSGKAAGHGSTAASL